MDFDALRAELGIDTQAELARQLGISESHLSGIKGGDRRLTIRLAAKIERLTGRTGLVQAVVDERTGAAA